MHKKKCIALDIDGTITHDKFRVPAEIADFLKSLHEKGFQIVITTGRTHAFARRLLETLPFPFIFCAQNGSIAMRYPEKKILLKKYLTFGVVSFIKKALEGISGNFVVYSGFENDDTCYYRKSQFTDHDLKYILELQARQAEKWVEVKDFDQNELKSFPLIKCFGSRIAMQRLQNKIRQMDGFENALVQDPFDVDYSLLLVTANGTSKGSTLTTLLQDLNIQTCIAAGDDENDMSLLKAATFKIAIDTGPREIIEIADIVAKPPKELGIIDALKEAIAKCK